MTLPRSEGVAAKFAERRRYGKADLSHGDFCSRVRGFCSVDRGPDRGSLDGGYHQREAVRGPPVWLGLLRGPRVYLAEVRKVCGGKIRRRVWEIGSRSL